MDQGDIMAAIKLLTKCVQLRSKALFKGHPDLGKSADKLAQCYAFIGKCVNYKCILTFYYSAIFVCREIWRVWENVANLPYRCWTSLWSVQHRNCKRVAEIHGCVDGIGVEQKSTCAWWAGKLFRRSHAHLPNPIWTMECQLQRVASQKGPFGFSVHELILSGLCILNKIYSI